jgi:hypothetical protein
MDAFTIRAGLTAKHEPLEMPHQLPNVHLTTLRSLTYALMGSVGDAAGVRDGLR